MSVHFFHSINPSYEPLYDAEVYSANSNVWREVGPSTTNHCRYYDSNVCLNGFLCCRGYRGMIAFDLDKDVFTCGINLPETSSKYCVTDFNDSIAFVAIMEDESNRVIQLCKLDNEACLRDGRVEASWTVMLTVALDFLDSYIFGCFKSGDFLLYTASNGYFVCNSHKNESRNVPNSVCNKHYNVIIID